MPANRPEDCDLNLAKAIMSGDLESAVALYEDNATFVTGPDSVANGIDQIREVMKGMLAEKPRLSLEVPRVVLSSDGNLAVLFSKWTSTVTGADGAEKSDSGNGREVVRKQADGTWKFIIDCPTAGDSN